MVDVDPTIWQYYNSKAETVDEEMIKDWNEGLKTLLLFVSQLTFPVNHLSVYMMCKITQSIALITRPLYSQPL
jgi:hypothetical protein